MALRGGGVDLTAVKIIDEHFQKTSNIITITVAHGAHPNRFEALFALSGTIAAHLCASMGNISHIFILN